MTLPLVTVDLTWVQGASLDYPFQITQGSPAVPINFAFGGDWTGRAEVRDNTVDNGGVLVLASTGTRINFTDRTNGKFSVVFTNTESSTPFITSTYSQLFCDPEFIDPAGLVHKYFIIRFAMQGEYTATV